jgi:hypothetical protein
MALSQAKRVKSRAPKQMSNILYLAGFFFFLRKLKLIEVCHISKADSASIQSFWLLSLHAAFSALHSHSGKWTSGLVECLRCWSTCVASTKPWVQTAVQPKMKNAGQSTPTSPVRGRQPWRGAPCTQSCTPSLHSTSIVWEELQFQHTCTHTYNYIRRPRDKVIVQWDGVGLLIMTDTTSWGFLICPLKSHI